MEVSGNSNLEIESGDVVSVRHDYDSVQINTYENYMPLQISNTEVTNDRTPDQENPVTSVSR